MLGSIWRRLDLFSKLSNNITLHKGPAVSNISDFDFNLGTIESESDSSGDETYLVPTSKDLAKSMRSK